METSRQLFYKTGYFSILKSFGRLRWIYQSQSDGEDQTWFCEGKSSHWGEWWDICVGYDLLVTYDWQIFKTVLQRIIHKVQRTSVEWGSEFHSFILSAVLRRDGTKNVEYERKWEDHNSGDTRSTFHKSSFQKILVETGKSSLILFILVTRILNTNWFIIRYNDVKWWYWVLSCSEAHHEGVPEFQGVCQPYWETVPRGLRNGQGIIFFI